MQYFLFCCVLTFGQGTTAEQKSKNAAKHAQGQLDILSNTAGVNFGPYLQPVLANIKKNWHSSIPASAATKKGRLAIEFTINKDGTLAKMSLVARPGGDDEDLVRPAWDSIKKLNPFPPLPREYKDDTLVLRFRFYYNLTP